MFGRLVRPPVLKNTGSVARDLLASERTFLAWARSGLGFIALGIALEKVEAFASISPTLLQLENSNTKLAAGALVGVGSLCVLHGTNRYFRVMRDIETGVFRPNTGGVVGMAALCVGVGFAGALLLMESEKKHHERFERNARKQQARNKTA
ncbi:hypothetical protein K431DRAFT_215701 [Polychaeton citri CBS 116435]|uniref:DUF202 domain-containing protein n=1 Tax=Polychaeton citri CBS 116435 TaxID=1314669 RepID=A0A9P4QH59_9PEZI|nr:hypothetical protein K431DRAFT_215701 [Polychaeton citri CBS 116435]